MPQHRKDTARVATESPQQIIEIMPSLIIVDAFLGLSAPATHNMVVINIIQHRFSYVDVEN